MELPDVATRATRSLEQGPSCSGGISQLLRLRGATPLDCRVACRTWHLLQLASLACMGGPSYAWPVPRMHGRSLHTRDRPGIRDTDRPHSAQRGSRQFHPVRREPMGHRGLKCAGGWSIQRAIDPALPHVVGPNLDQSQSSKYSLVDRLHSQAVKWGACLSPSGAREVDYVKIAHPCILGAMALPRFRALLVIPYLKAY